MTNRTVCVVDHGQFVDLAQWLGDHFDRVLYCTAWQCFMPESNKCMSGYGLVEVIESIWDHLDEIDLFVFPDIYHGPTQRYLESIGKRVWGSREGENLEIWRTDAKSYMKEQGINIGPYEVVKGTDSLRKALKGTKDKFVKISKTRGDFETYHHTEWTTTEPWLDDVEYRIGPKKHVMEFIVEDAINDAVEIGFDGYCIDGQFSSPGIVGVEIKDAGYLGRVVETLPRPLQDVNDRLGPTFKAVHYRNFFCSEVRVQGTKGYMLDPCCRIPNPPGDLYTDWIGNLADILWQGGNGDYVAPKYTARWGAEIMFLSEWSSTKWNSIEIPDELKPHLKLRGKVRVEGKDYIMPGVGVGGVTALGNTAQQAMNQCLDIANECVGLELMFKEEALDKAKEEFDQIKWTEPEKTKVTRPDPESLAALLSPKSLSESLQTSLNG